MSIQNIIKDKKEWRAHMARVKALPQDYQIVYKEIQKYLIKVGPAELTNGSDLLSGIIDLFEESTALEKGVLEVTGSNVAAFCDDLIKNSNVYLIHQAGHHTQNLRMVSFHVFYPILPHSLSRLT